LTTIWKKNYTSSGREKILKIDYDRDGLLTAFGKATLEDRYLLEGEEPQDLFARVASAYGSGEDHAQRLYDYMSRLWFMPATPILSNGGTSRGLPISCYLNHVPDSMKGIADVWNENVFLASKGGGIGTYWGGVRGIGERVGQNGHTSGVIPFIKVMDSLTLAISQGSLRRGSAAVYLDISHPEIEEFLEIRKPSGDFNRKSLNIHHGVLIDDDFMHAVRAGKSYSLKSPRTGQETRLVDARSLFEKLLETRLATGEPYIVFSDTVNRSIPSHHAKTGLRVSTSNLCSEITLPTSADRTAVCCLSSLNLETYDEWKDDDLFIHDVMEMLDNVIEDFIQKAPDEMAKAKYSAYRERSVGLGVMGFHSYLQSKGIPFESALAKSFNYRAFRHISEQCDLADKRLAESRGSCPDARDAGEMRRFSNKTAIAPTASISIICGGTSACIEPIPANVYTHKTLSGSFVVKNKYLDELIWKYVERERQWDPSWSVENEQLAYDNIWSLILENEGSVQHLDFLSQDEKDTFKTAFEIDQRYIVEFASDRQPFIDQSQSLNLYIPADIHKRDLMMLHYKGWRDGVKSFYYLRSKSLQRAGFAGGVERDNTIEAPEVNIELDYEECLSCQ
jgi:ribonucleoside-diphosphate reductase alpha chain